MKKQISIWGGRFFQGVIYNELTGKYQYTSNDCLKKLCDKYEVLNYSMSNMDTKKALKYISKSLVNNNFYQSVIALGEYEVISMQKDYNETHLLLSLANFKHDLEEIITILKNASVKPVLVSLQPSDYIHFDYSSDNKTLELIYNAYNQAIIDISVKEHVKLIDLASYYKTEDSNIAKFITDQNAQNQVGNALSEEII